MKRDKLDRYRKRARELFANARIVVQGREVILFRGDSPLFGCSERSFPQRFEGFMDGFKAACQPGHAKKMPNIERTKQVAAQFRAFGNQNVVSDNETIAVLGSAVSKEITDYMHKWSKKHEALGPLHPGWMECPCEIAAQIRNKLGIRLEH